MCNLCFFCPTWHYLGVAPHHCHELLSKQETKTAFIGDASNTVLNGKFTVNINWCLISVNQHYAFRDAWRHKYHIANPWITTHHFYTLLEINGPIAIGIYRLQKWYRWFIMEFAVTTVCHLQHLLILQLNWAMVCLTFHKPNYSSFLCKNIGVLISTTGCSVRNKVQKSRKPVEKASHFPVQTNKESIEIQSDFRKIETSNK